ncbi:TPA: restriction endonuclease subunit S [Escherichia coli]|uniref:restriction endonuclease subunit S n=1 Tax=Escherichia coli TaxID=562 RepID=UPI000D6A608F|nr:restriction endonuclease subunit S [Escherichia coli]MBB7654940.1 restriction endonuclease subunit S [Escherichia coli]MCV0495540.1 restriction endonuclease subunit S [Escherichia coli]HAI4627690.1 restriction endonuclease subunit S [Escherichia coli]HAM4850361.1 restriction endonuclease subunit S [Escherichia coli]
MAGLNKYQAYPEYRDSGMEWLGEIPYQWKLSRVKYIAPFQVGWTPSTKNDANFIGNNLWVNISDLQGKFISSTAKCISDQAAKEASMEITPRGSLLYSFKLSVGVISFADCDLYTNEAIASFLNKAELPLSYLYYALPKFIIENSSTNIYGAKILNQELIRNSFLLKPSHNEAEKIADFLDHETAKIDNLIEKQQQLIELLKEKRQAVISHAVTKGLNPDVPMKDSGVEWLGEIPNNWITIKLKFITTLRSEKIVLPHTRYVGLENISSGDGSFIVTTDITPESTSLLFEKDDILFGKLRPYLAKAWLATFSGVCSSEFLVLKVEKLNPKYLNYFILSQTFIKQVDSSTYGTKMPRANWEDIGQLPIPLCSYEESKKIAMYLDKLTANLDILKEQQLHQIELLKERRTALISAAVTGKIDLRNWTAPIPEAETPTEVSA